MSSRAGVTHSAAYQQKVEAKVNAEAGAVVRPLLPYGVGIDCHSKFIQVCVLFQSGGKVRQLEQEFMTEWPDLCRAHAWAFEIARQAEPLTDAATFRYTIESTGTYHRPVLLAWRGKPSVINPMLAGPTRRKTDVLDARMLAQQSMGALWAASFMPSEDTEILRILLGARHEAVRNGTRCLNRINNHLLRFGHTVGREVSMGDMYARGAVDDLCRGVVPSGPTICPAGIPVPVRAFFLDLYKAYDDFKDTAKEYHDAAMSFIKTTEWQTGGGGVNGAKLLKLLITVPGIGEVSAMTWLAIVGDPRRFENSKQVAAFCGADPSLKVSAGKVTSHVKRKGNARLHHALKNVAAQLVRRNREAVGMWGFNIYRRHAKGGWARAINAVSRRLAIFLWHVHRTGQEFSLDKFKFYDVPDVVDVPLEDMGLSSVYVTRLREAGCSRSTDVARAFMTSLPQQKGIGAGCLAKVKEWLSQNGRKGSSSEARSLADAVVSSQMQRPAKSVPASPISSTAVEPRSCSTSGIPKLPSPSTPQSKSPSTLVRTLEKAGFPDTPSPSPTKARRARNSKPKLGGERKVL